MMPLMVSFLQRQHIMKTTRPVPHNGDDNLDATINLRHLTIETLRRAVDALAHGDVAMAQKLMSAKRSSSIPPGVPALLSELAPAYAALESSVEVANNLYVETLREKEALLRVIRDQHGPGPFIRPDGATVVIVARTRGDREQLFLRTIAPPPEPHK